MLLLLLLLLLVGGVEVVVGVAVVGPLLAAEVYGVCLFVWLFFLGMDIPKHTKTYTQNMYTHTPNQPNTKHQAIK